VTILNLIAFALVVYGLRLVFRQINRDAGWAPRSSAVATGAPPPGTVATAKYLLMDDGQRAMIEHGAQAGNLAAGIPERQKGARIALGGAVLVLVASVLPLWWT
jgi:hypothetical protein